jgi:glycosyltransferase involved in cell wall biosynthesis
MNPEPLITIITVVFNGEKYLEQTIQSVINQTYKNIEYLIIDGGSTDGTLDIIRQYEKHISYWVSEPDKGLYDAMNKGIGLAKGELIGMINSDDWYELNAVEIMVNAFILNPSKTIFHADRFNINNNGERHIRKFHPSSFKFKYYGMTYNHPSMFIARKEYEKHLYNPSLKSHSDYQFVLETFLNNPQNFNYSPQAIVNYRLDGISANMQFWEATCAVYSVRRKVGLSILESSLAFIFTRCVGFFTYFKNIIK